MNRWGRFLLGVGLACAAFMSGACGGGAGGTAGDPADTSAPGLDELMDATYSGIGSGGPVKLTGGRYEDTRTRREITLAPDFRIAGDLDGDGREEAVVLLAESPGGSGTFHHVAVVGRERGATRNLATAPLGDRVQVRDARIEDRRLVVDVLRAGPGDAMCCPGELATLAWELRGRRLETLAADTPPTRLSLEAIAGVEWVLRHWTWGEPVMPGIEITLELRGDAAAGRAPCNRYLAALTEGDTPGKLTFATPGSTRMACPDPGMAAERRYLARLTSVRSFSFLNGQLALNFLEDGRIGSMLFQRGSETPR